MKYDVGAFNNRGMLSKLILEGIMKKNDSFLPRHLILPLLFNPLQILQPPKQSINVSLPILTNIPNAEAPGIFNPVKTKRRPLYLKTQSVPRCKHFSSLL